VDGYDLWLKYVGACKLSFVQLLKIKLLCRRQLHGTCRTLNVFECFFIENKSSYQDKGKKGYWKLKVEALDHTVWRTGLERGCGPS